MVGPRAIFRCFVAVFPLFAACGGQVTDSEPAPVSRSTSSAPALSSPAATREEADQTPRIIFLGDSLTAGLGLDVQRSFPSLIQQRLDANGYDYRVVNAGVSGDTSAGALRRLEWAMAEGDPKVLVVALGGNDGLRGLAPEQLEKNLATIIEKALARGLRVILAGMEAPPNFGADYTTRFRAVYSTLAERYSLRLIPFLLDGVAGTAALNQADGIHPNEAGAKVVADLVWRTLEPELARTRAASSR
jgi:acyl-CoA thioesterase-1